jgi:hypothetical protein
MFAAHQQLLQVFPKNRICLNPVVMRIFWLDEVKPFAFILD